MGGVFFWERNNKRKHNVGFLALCAVQLLPESPNFFLTKKLCFFFLQEERQRTKERDQNEVESTSTLITADLSIDRILEAERRMECSSPEMMEDVEVS